MPPHKRAVKHFTVWFLTCRQRYITSWATPKFIFECSSCEFSFSYWPRYIPDICNVLEQSCVCTNFSHKSRWSKEENPICINCKPGEVATKDGKSCVPCGDTSDKTRTKLVKCKNCSSNEISGTMLSK